ncbi:MAG: hypothetical protein OER78_00520 [Nitrosopumilus sp.]|nr:hypothetical protein [Nitrosopumilus sp.]MDH3854630.1 hypothetical protein [Nitrosopumilus sp.]
MAQNDIIENKYEGKMSIGSYQLNFEIKLTADGSEKTAELISNNAETNVFIAVGGNGITAQKSKGATKGSDAMINVKNIEKALTITFGGNGVDRIADEKLFPGTKGNNGTDGGSVTIWTGNNSDAFGYSGKGGNGQEGARGRAPRNSNPGPRPDGAKIVSWSVIKAARVLTGTEKESLESINSGDGGNGGDGGNVSIRMKGESFAEAVAGDGGIGGKPGLAPPDSKNGNEGKAGNGGTIDVEGGPESTLSQNSHPGLKGIDGVEGNSGKWLIHIT